MLLFSSITLRLPVYTKHSLSQAQGTPERVAQPDSRGRISEAPGKGKDKPEERGVVSSCQACLLSQLRKKECADHSFMAQTTPAQFFCSFSFSLAFFSLNSPIAPNKF